MQPQPDLQTFFLVFAFKSLYSKNGGQSSAFRRFLCALRGQIDIERNSTS